MLIKVCGMREPDNIRAVESLGVDMLGFIFYPESSRFVSMISSRAGIIPDYALPGLSAGNISVCPKRVGVFVDDMPQNIVTRVYNYELDYVQLHGDESPVMIDNLRRTIDPDIHPGIQIIKALSIREKDDIKRWRDYQGHADMLLFDTKCDGYGGSGDKFDWSMLDEYDGDIPFLLSGGIGPEDADAIKGITHPMFAGVDLNSRFEISPALKDVEKLSNFIDKLRD